MRKTFVAVIIYRPNKSLLRLNIESFSKFVEKIIIWDNMIETESCRYRIDLPNNAEYRGLGENIGISKALNICLNMANEQGFEYFMSMDQDSIWGNFKEFKLNAVDFLSKKNCIIGPIINGEKYPNFNSFLQIKWLITSGMFSKVETLIKIGGYNENFFVDSIDIELSLRAHYKSVETYICQKGFLQQNFGESNTISFGTKKYTIQYYSPNRIESILMGNVILYRLYKHNANLKEILVFVKATIKSIIFNTDKKRYRRIKAIFCGIMKGMFCKIDKYKL